MVLILVHMRCCNLILHLNPRVNLAQDQLQQDLKDATTTRNPVCLKKYCKCYRGSVGCFIAYICEKCKNAFSKKDVDSTLVNNALDKKKNSIAANYPPRRRFSVIRDFPPLCEWNVSLGDKVVVEGEGIVGPLS